MKIIEAMKRVKRNEEKIAELQALIANNSAKLSTEPSAYDNPGKKVKEWLQSCTDLTQECVKLLIDIQRTNLATSVTIEIGGKSVTKSIAEWVWRRRKYAELDRATWMKLTDRNLRGGVVQPTPNSTPISVNVERFFDAEERDTRVSMYREEPGLIDAALEVVNATTEIIE